MPTRDGVGGEGERHGDSSRVREGLMGVDDVEALSPGYFNIRRALFPRHFWSPRPPSPLFFPRMASALKGCAICPRLHLRATPRPCRLVPTTRCMASASEAGAEKVENESAAETTPPGLAYGRNRARALAQAEIDTHPVAFGKRYHGANLMDDDSVFGELSLNEASQKVPGVRVRQHVNPLKASLQVQVPPPQWHVVFKDNTKPLLVDIGCGGGRFDLMFAKRNPEMNVLGVDIRAPLVDRGNAWGAVAGIVDNVHFAECNATVSMGRWLKSYASGGAGGPVAMVAIQFPDPHFKTRHHKRRVVQPSLVRAVAEGLAPGARVFLQSDVLEVSTDMREKFEKFGAHLFDIDSKLHDVSGIDQTAARQNVEHARNAGFGKKTEDGDETNDQRDDDERQAAEVSPGIDIDDAVSVTFEKPWTSAWAKADGDKDGWLDVNPLGVPTERECQTNDQGERCYRVMLVRNDVPVPERAA